MWQLKPNQLLEALHWRYAVKKFDPSRKIPADIWSVLEQALVLSPSSFGLQPWKFVVITDPELKARLVAASWGQKQPADCSHHVVFAAKDNPGKPDVDRFLARSAEVQGVDASSFDGYKRVMYGFVEGAVQARGEEALNHWAALQVYIALGGFMTAAAALGVDVCPMEGIAPAEYDAALGLQEIGYRTIVCAAAGYRASDDKYATSPKVRYPLEEVIMRK